MERAPARRAAEREEVAAAWRQETSPVIKERLLSRAPGWSSKTSPGML
jgi:predicted kinase